MIEMLSWQNIVAGRRQEVQLSFFFIPSSVKTRVNENGWGYSYL
jgi:hypothetical protein